MKYRIASMTVFCNEDFRINAWREYYNEYKSSLTYHIIINNGNKPKSKYLKDIFPESIVLECDTPNLLAAYNVGLKYILSNLDVDAIMQITNDVRFEKGAIEVLTNVLFSKPEIGAVGPVLFKKDSRIVESFGWVLKSKMGFGKPLHINEVWDSNRKDIKTVTFIPAGVLLVKSKVWKIIGEQDECLWMYQDERDFSIRLKKNGYIEVVTAEARAWHQHQNRPGKESRPLSAAYYSSRNKIYVTEKHFGKPLALTEFTICSGYNILLMLYHFLSGKFRYLHIDRIVQKGLWHGILKRMKPLL